MANRLITFESLVEYCKTHESFSFSAKEYGHPLVVTTFGRLEYSATNDAGLMSVVLKSCHTDLNRNNSFIKEDVMTRALPSFANKPILAEIRKNKDGEYDFGTHAITYEQDDEGNVKTKYIERPVGIVPESCNARLEYDKEKDKTYVVVDGYIFTYYGNETSEILQRRGGTEVSVELDVYDVSWNAKEKYLEINDFIFCGVTLLGEDVEPGMEGARLDISDFSHYSSIDFTKEINEMKSRLALLENCVSDKYSKEGGKTQIMSKFEELLIQYGKTAEDITFEYSDLSDEELEAKFAEMFGEDSSDPSSEGADEGNESDDGKTGETDGKSEDSNEGSVESDSGKKGATEGDSSNDDNSDDDSAWGTGETSGQKSDDEDTGDTSTKKKFELSMQDTISALTELVNATYSESDNDWYCVTAYKDYLVMTGWWSGRSYKQSYKNEEDTFSLVGDRTEVYCQYLTQEEIDELDELRKNYSALVEYKNNVEQSELIAQKNALLEDERFDIIKDNDSYKELVDNKDNYSLEELETNLKLIVADFALGSKTFSAFNRQKGGKMFSIPGKGENVINSRYGGIFKEKK